MSLFEHQVKDDILWVTFDSGGMNTLSAGAIEELTKIVRTSTFVKLTGAVLIGNKYGLGAGANIGELMNADRETLADFVDQGHKLLFLIEQSSFPWLALIDGFCLGGIYELALACRAIVATEKSKIGFPEIQLNIFPGLGGTQRMPRRSGLLNPQDPINGDAGFTAILKGKQLSAKQACAINMIDAVIPPNIVPEEFAAQYLRNVLPTLERPVVDLSNAESLREMVLDTVRRGTLGRPNPRAPYVAVEVMIEGANVPLNQAVALERDAFLDVATSPEGRAGMRFFFTQQSVQKPPKVLPKPAQLKTIGVAGIDGYMGNGIGWLCLEAGYPVIGYIPTAALQAMNLNLDQAAEQVVRQKLRAKYERAVSKGTLTSEEVARRIAQVIITNDPQMLQPCDLVVEALFEDRAIKDDFFTSLANTGFTGIVASNSSSMGPGMLASAFTMAGGDPRHFINAHFFSPVEHPMMQLVEIIRSTQTDDQTVATMHAFARRINKTPIILNDGSPGFLVNAGLAAYMLEAETMFREGTPIEVIDDAMKSVVFPVGPFALGDQAGLDIAAGMFDTIAASEPLPFEPLVWQMRKQKRFGQKNGAGFYSYQNGRAVEVWAGLDNLVHRGHHESTPRQIVERCMRALYTKARELCDRGIVASEAECDLAIVFGIGFAMYLGGPIFYGQQQEWEQELRAAQ